MLTSFLAIPVNDGTHGPRMRRVNVEADLETSVRQASPGIPRAVLRTRKELTLFSEASSMRKAVSPSLARSDQSWHWDVSSCCSTSSSSADASWKTSRGNGPPRAFWLLAERCA